MRTIFTVVAAAVLGLATTTTTAFAQHNDMAIASSADGSGQLTIEYDFTTRVALPYDATLSTLFGASVYSSTDPGYESLEADEPLESLYRVDVGTTVSMEITAIETGRVAAVLNGTPLAQVGDTAVIGTEDGAEGLHHHPELRLILMTTPDQPGEGSISFKLTTTNPSYTESVSFTMHLFNSDAFVTYDAGFDTDSNKCSDAVGKSVGKFIGKQYGILAKCMTTVADVVATEEGGGSPAELAAAEDKAAKTCGDASGTLPATATMLAKLQKEYDKASSLIDKACGALGSGDFDGDKIARHLNDASCQVQALIAKANVEARGVLSTITQAGNPVSDGLPCLWATQRTE